MNDQSGKISIVIPVFNSSAYIKECVESVYNQTYQNFNIIVVDDGSSDNSLSILNEYKENKNLDNLILISQENRGPSYARNRGLEVADGEYIAFLDSDDKWLPSKLERQLDIFIKYPEIDLLGTTHIKDKVIGGLKKITFKSLLLSNQLITSSILVKSSVIRKYRFSVVQKYSEDVRLWMEILSDGYTCALLKEGLVSQTSNRLNATNSLSSNLWNMELYELKNILDCLKHKRINVFNYLYYSSYSILKFTRRIIIKLINNEKIYYFYNYLFII